MMELCLSGNIIAIALSKVRGSRARIPELTMLFREMVYIAHCSVVVLFGAPTNLLFIIPNPLKTPTIQVRVSLIATLMIKRFWQLASLILR